MSEKVKSPNDRQVWDKCVAEARREVPEIKSDLPTIRRVLWESRKRHTVRVRSQLP